MEKNKFTPEELEDFIRNNKDKFEVYPPKENHFDIFLLRLQERLHKIYISIIPHLIKLAISTVVVFTISLFVWNGWIRPDRDQMPLKSVSREYRIMERNYISDIKAKEKQVFNVYLKNDMDTKTTVYNGILSIDSCYVDLKKELKKNPNNEKIIKAMIHYYDTKTNILNTIISKFDTTKVK